MTNLFEASIDIFANDTVYESENDLKLRIKNVCGNLEFHYLDGNTWIPCSDQRIVKHDLIANWVLVEDNKTLSDKAQFGFGKLEKHVYLHKDVKEALEKLNDWIVDNQENLTAFQLYAELKEIFGGELL